MSDKVSDVIKSHALTVYEREGQNKLRTAKALGVSLKTLYNWLNKWEVKT